MVLLDELDRLDELLNFLLTSCLEPLSIRLGRITN